MNAVILKVAAWPVAALALLFGLAVQSSAQQRPVILSPAPERGTADGPLCYYAGLSYSSGAVITIKVPIRREIVTDRKWQELRCEILPTAPGSVIWVEVDSDESDTFRD